MFLRLELLSLYECWTFNAVSLSNNVFCAVSVPQAALGESKKDKGNESVHVFLNIDGKKMVLGTLNGQNIPQLSFDLVFEKQFELSHNWKNGSVYFCGYQTPLPDEYPSQFTSI